MLDLLTAVAVFTLTVAVGAGLLAALTALPWFVAVEMAERRGFSLTRWGAGSLAASGVGLALAQILRGAKAPTVLWVVTLTLCWSVPGVLWLTEAGQVRIGGRTGQHQ
ncbi:MAG: hypothetical protein M3N21_04710 [Actinomycetota bacterium]|nr:hypothetical protein [Actinomycetota bacterium]